MSRGEGLAGLGRAAIPPLLSAVALVGLLSAWVVTGGAGTLHRDHVEIELAAIPVNYQAGPITLRTAATYLDIRNLGPADVIVSARSSACARVEFLRKGSSAPRGSLVTSLTIAGHVTTDLNPFGTDVVLVHPKPLLIGETVPLTLVFRQAGEVRIDLPVTDSLAVPGS